MPHHAGRDASLRRSTGTPLPKETSRDVLSGTAWLLLTMSVLPLMTHYLIGENSNVECGAYCGARIVGTIALWAGGSLLLPFTRITGRIFVTLAILFTVFAGSIDGHSLLGEPVLLLAIIITVMLVLSRLWLFHDLHLLSAHYARSSEVKRVGRQGRLAAIGATLVALAHWMINASPGDAHYYAVAAAAFTASGIANLALALAVLRIARRHIWRALWIIVSVVIALLVFTQGQLDLRAQVFISLLPAFIGAFLLPRGLRASGEQIDWWEPLVREPSRLFVVLFLMMSLVSALFLSLPIASRPDMHLSAIDALFMAVSAVCVTGLATVPPHDEFSLIGQIIFIVSVQLGGLGIMTFSLAAVGVLRRRVSMRVESVVAGLFSEGDRRTIRRALVVVLGYTFGVEAIGASILSVGYWFEGMAPVKAIGHGVFAAISAFNNAGHTLTGGDIHIYAESPMMILTIAWLVILGGCSPFLILAIWHWRSRERMPATHKLALVMTITLLAIGWLGFLAFEWQETLRDYDWGHKVTNAFFQSASARTGGFTTVDLGQAHPATIVMIMVLMVIGGNPGGTAGGIKTITVAILVLAVVAAIRGRNQVRIGYRFLPHSAVYRAAATASVMAAAIFGFSMLMLLTQSHGARDLIFEVTSALTTTGHSLGITPNLDTVGKSIIIACMFIGRVGMLTLFMFLSSRELAGTWQLTEEDIDLG